MTGGVGWLDCPSVVRGGLAEKLTVVVRECAVHAWGKSDPGREQPMQGSRGGVLCACHFDGNDILYL